ncbi:hypothetical protein Tco_1370785 [Tanacetum coccineum]
MPTEMELTLVQKPQGVSHDSLVQTTGHTYAVRNIQLLSDIEDSHGPSDAMHNPSQLLQSQKTLVSKITEIHSFLSSLISHSVLVDIEKVGTQLQPDH